MANEDNPSENKIDYDTDSVIKRLIDEQTKTSTLIKKAKRALGADTEFEGLSLLGGIKALLKRYHEEKAKNQKLNKELDQMIKEQIDKKNR